MNKNEFDGLVTEVDGSVTIKIPREAMDQLGLTAKSRMTIYIEDGKFSAKKQNRPRYKLADLLAQCDFSIPPTREELDWLNDPPVGRERI
jgi:antitoxin ChpS